MSEVDDLGEALRLAVSRDCTECGLENPSQAVECERCGHELPPLEEERRVSFREGAMVYAKTALEDSWNLKVLRLSVETLADGRIDLEEYQRHVTHVLTGARDFLAKLETQAASLDGLDEDSHSILARTIVHYQAFVEGCGRMLEASLADQEPARAGLELVRQALTALDRLEDEATDRLRDLEEEILEDDEEDEEE